jgi:hypothetical protein
VPIKYRQEAPHALRKYLKEALYHYINDEYKRRDFAYTSMDILPPASYNNLTNQIDYLIQTVEWYQIYDSIERLHDHLLYKSQGKTMQTPTSREFLRLTNSFFDRGGYAWRFGSFGELEYRGEESFDAAVSNAAIALKQIGSETALSEIHKALEDLARRPEPDLSGAIQHAMAGLECVANQVTGTSGLELGKVIKANQDRFPPPLNDVLPKLYGYASNNGRHLTEGQDPDFPEAELLVGIAATVSTYLARKADSHSNR